MDRVMGFVLTATLAVAGVVLLTSIFQRSLIYFPFGDVPEPHQVGLTAAEEVTFPTEDGLSLNGWFLPRGAAAATVLVLNGNAGNRAFRAPLAVALQRRGLQVLLFDYRGYGDNEGTPTESGLRADARAAYRYLVVRSDVDADRLVYFGESLGTAVATGLAAEHPPAGLILRSPFDSLVDIGRAHYPFLPVRTLLEDRFMAIEDITRVTSPVLVVVGDADRIVPMDHSQRLYDAASSPKELVVLPGVGHNDAALLDGDEMLAAIDRLVAGLS